MSANPYPNLGFNPTPGLTQDVDGLRVQIKKAADGVRETNELLNQLRNAEDDVWIGDAGDAFRAHFDATLGQDLKLAQTSLERAVTLVQEWFTTLVGYQQTAAGLEREAAEARGKHSQASTALDSAKQNPDLKLAGVYFSDPTELQAAQARLDAATAKVTAAVAAVDEAQGQIDSIIRRARDLETEHATTARKIATELRAAALLAPTENKSLWDWLVDKVKDLGNWIDEHRKGIHDALSIVSAVAGLLALVTPPPINAIALGVSLVAGAGALALTLTDDEVWKDLTEGSWKDKGLAALTIAGDGLALIPGVGALGKTAKVGLLGDGIGDVGKLESMARTWTEAAGNPGALNKYLTDNNIRGVTDGLNKEIFNGISANSGVNKVLQLTGAVGAHTTPDPAVALAVLKRTEGAVGSIAGVALSNLFGG
ncbi:hypothetical protein [Nocardia sp. NPDC051832]|uniref:hypothetical protein n=1 Tax=Nocardia sp. NPDC051832 TaxID=3155673 RepID=UPI00342E95ED